MNILCKLFGHKMGYLEESDIYSRPVCVRCKHVGAAVADGWRRETKTEIPLSIGDDEVLVLMYRKDLHQEAVMRIKREFDLAMSEGKASVAVVAGIDSWAVIKRPAKTYHP